MTVKTVVQAQIIYRDSPNTFGHERNDVKRFELKRLMGLVASQRFLQESIVDAGFNDFAEISHGIRHLWVRLKDVEDALREAEDRYGCTVMERMCMTLPGKVHPVPSIALMHKQMEAQQTA